jgi:hypothetical protein
VPPERACRDSSILVGRALGRFCAEREQGWRVFAGVRDPAAVDLAGAEIIELDVTSAASVASVAELVR